MVSSLTKVVPVKATAATATALAASHWWTSASRFRLSLFDVDSPAVDFCHLLVTNQVLCYVLILKCDESESSRVSREDVIQNNCICYFPKLSEVIL